MDGYPKVSKRHNLEPTAKIGSRARQKRMTHASLLNSTTTRLHLAFGCASINNISFRLHSRSDSVELLWNLTEGGERVVTPMIDSKPQMLGNTASFILCPFWLLLGDSSRSCRAGKNIPQNPVDCGQSLIQSSACDIFAIGKNLFSTYKSLERSTKFWLPDIDFLRGFRLPFSFDVLSSDALRYNFLLFPDDWDSPITENACPYA